MSASRYGQDVRPERVLIAATVLRSLVLKTNSNLQLDTVREVVGEKFLQRGQKLPELVEDMPGEEEWARAAISDALIDRLS